MAADRKSTLSLMILTLTTAISILGTTAGALAWYAYSRSVTFSYVGTSVAKSELLNIGLVDDDHYFSSDDELEFELSRETVIQQGETHSVCFSKSKSGLSVEAIQKYLRRSGHAIDQLFPLTTQERALDDESDLELYQNPEYGFEDITGAAKVSQYSVLPFAFKIIGDDADYVAGKSVWLTETVVKAEEGIENSLRVYVQGTERNFLLRPSDTSTSPGSTKVGGVLDLDGDGTYDYNKGTGKEYCYGKFDVPRENIPFSQDRYGIPKSDCEVDDVNGVNDPDNAPSTFLAKHNQDAYVADFTNVHPLLAHYETFGTTKPLIRNNGEYYAGDTGIPLATTTETSKVGYVTLTIFIEGWDHAVVDKAAGYSFNLGLRFEIDRI